MDDSLISDETKREVQTLRWPSHDAWPAVQDGPVAPPMRFLDCGAGLSGAQMRDELIDEQGILGGIL